MECKYLNRIRTDLTWAVAVHTTIKSVAFANKTEGAVPAVQEYSFFGTVFENGIFLRAGVISRCC